MHARIAVAAALAVAAAAQAQPCVRQFSPEFASADLNGNVTTAAVFDDGSGPALYVAGSFTTAGGAAANRIARWDGHAWTPLGSGLNSTVQALAVFDDGSGPALYAAGSFSMAGGASASCIARWNGSAWAPLGTGLNTTVQTMAVFDEDGPGPNPPRLFVGGDFTLAGGASANRIARWNGSAWSTVGAGCNGQVSSLHVHDDGSGQALFVGGNFTTADGGAAMRIARWDGSAYSPLGAGASAAVRSMATFDPDGPGPLPPELVAGGEFTTIGAVSANRVARWNGSAWLDMGAGVNNTVLCLGVYDDGSGPALFAGGNFLLAGGASALRIAMWDGSGWSPTASGLNATVNALVTFDDGRGERLYACGLFTSAGGANAVRIAMWDGANWSGLDRGVSDPINVMHAHADAQGTHLYLGGDFIRADGTAVNRIARFDGQGFADVGGGFLSGTVSSLASFNDGSGPALYAGGSFTTIASGTANRIARWDGSAWSPLVVGAANGVNGVVNAMIVWDDGSGPALYAAGNFSASGGTTITRIARWNGSAWSPLGSGLNSTVNALAAYDDGSGPALYVGGSFTSAGGAPAGRIARWNGSAWSEVGGGVNNAVNALAVYDDGSGPRLYAGGTFTVAGATSVNRIARWNGSAWSDVGGGVDNAVNALAVFDEDGAGPNPPSLFVGGTFTNAGGVVHNRLARWNGSAWSPLGPTTIPPTPGMNAAVNALAVFGSGSGQALYAGGSFTTAGGVPSARLAAWACPPVAPCYANCDGSSTQPVLNVNDFVCFQQRFAAGDPYANCDGSTIAPILNVNDFVCFQQQFAAGCN